jgi:hypothetical protein
MRTFKEMSLNKKMETKLEKGLLRDSDGKLIEGRKKITSREQLLDRMNKSTFLKGDTK